MTGFGRGESTDGISTATAEIKTVNHRYGEFLVKLPRRYSFAEEAVKQVVRNYVARGKADIIANMTDLSADESAVSVNLQAARQYMDGINELKEELELSGGSTDQTALYLLATQPEILKSTLNEKDEASISGLLAEAMEAAAKNLNEMRAVEGEKLAADLRSRADIIDDLLGNIEKRAPELAGIYQEKLGERVEILLAKGGYSDADLKDRIAVEVAMFADRSNITEEIIRLQSHLSQLRSTLSGTDEQAVGKKLDFLVQEMNREANTIGSKANDLKITDLVIEMKSEIEKIREQVQNIE